MKLRPYQEDSLKAILKAYRNAVTKQLIVLPTGSGKTIVFAALCKKTKRRALVLAHRQELLYQAEDKIKSYWPEAQTGFVWRDYADYGAQVVIGSVQSCRTPKRLTELKKQKFNLLIIDEAHHATAPSYKKIIEHLGFHKHKTKLMVGVTATPYRENKGSLDEIFDEITYTKEIQELINDGYLSPVRGRKIRTEIDLNDVKTVAGDFQQDMLARKVDTSNRNELIVAKYLEHAPKRKGVTFCVNVKHCINLALEYTNAGIPALAVWGGMRPQQRQDALKQFNEGKVQMLTSCGVLTEGFDEPSIECIVMARPTKSKTLYIQCVGRGLRLHEGKRDCLVLDISDSLHNLKTIINLKSMLPKAQVIKDKTPQELQQEEEERLRAKERVIQDTEFDIVGAGKTPINLLWIPISPIEEITLGYRYEKGKRIATWEFVKSDLGTGLYTLWLYRHDPEHNGHNHIQVHGGVLELDEATLNRYVIDAQDVGVNFTLSNRNAPWFQEGLTIPMTAGQKRMLFDLTKTSYLNLTKTHAAVEIGRLMALKRKEKRERPLSSPMPRELEK